MQGMRYLILVTLGSGFRVPTVLLCTGSVSTTVSYCRLPPIVFSVYLMLFFAPSLWMTCQHCWRYLHPMYGAEVKRVLLHTNVRIWVDDTTFHLAADNQLCSLLFEECFNYLFQIRFFHVNSLLWREFLFVYKTTRFPDSFLTVVHSSSSVWFSDWSCCDSAFRGKKNFWCLDLQLGWTLRRFKVGLGLWCQLPPPTERECANSIRRSPEKMNQFSLCCHFWKDKKKLWGDPNGTGPVLHSEVLSLILSTHQGICFMTS